MKQKKTLYEFDNEFEEMWNPETDACVYCMECEYFIDDYWNCQGDIEPCWEFLPKKDSDSKYKKVEIEVDRSE